ncbi:MAG: NAD(P)-binding domain-containing protein, partial [Myxococcota bacterium]
MESLPALLCVAFIAIVFVIPMWAYINLTERRARIERDKAVESGRHEPVTIQPYVDLSVCMGSGACVPACPEDVLKVIDGQAVAVSMSACIGHGACVTACPVGAIELVFGSEKRGIDIPRVGPDFQSNVPGIYIAGELGGMGLIANAIEQGVRTMTNLAKTLSKRGDQIDVAIIGAGPAGLAAAATAKTLGVNYLLLDQDALGGAVRHYPRKKLVFTRNIEVPGYGKVALKTLLKEELVGLFEDIVAKVGLEVSTSERVDKIQSAQGGFTITTSKRQISAQKVVLSLGRRGTPRKLDAPGEDQEKVAYSLLEPEQYEYDHLMIVGGGDSAVEAAIQLAEQPGNKVYLSYRGDKINRPKEKNIHRLRDAVKAKQVELLLESQIKDIGPDRIVLEQRGEQIVLPNDYVFVMVGGVLPTKFLQDAGIKIQKHFGKRIESGEDAPKKDRAKDGDKPDRADGDRAGKGDRAKDAGGAPARDTSQPHKVPSAPIEFIQPAAPPRARGNEDLTVGLKVPRGGSEEPTLAIDLSSLGSDVAAMADAMADALATSSGGPTVTTSSGAMSSGATSSGGPTVAMSAGAM